jgi:endonuclease-3
MDRQVKTELAWLIPYRISEKLRNFEFQTLAALSLLEVENLMEVPSPLHRFPSEMSKNLYFAIQTISENYGGVASNIWSDKPSGAEVVYRFLQFRGIGQKIGTMAANILARNFKVEFSDCSHQESFLQAGFDAQPNLKRADNFSSKSIVTAVPRAFRFARLGNWANMV